MIRPEIQNRPKRPPGLRSSCEPFREEIQKKLELGLHAKRIWQDLVLEHGFDGAYNSVKRFCRKLKAESPRVFARVETPPGRDMQVDFGKAALTQTESGRYRRPHLFKAVLCYSRHSYEEVVWRQDLETFVRCVENAFHWFGGSVDVVRLDNLKAGVTRACFVDPEINAVFSALGRHYSFAIIPIHPGSPNENGKVERTIGYTKSSALKGRRFESLAEQNEHLRNWNERVARQRIHGTTKQQVWPRFLEEQKGLRPLPDSPLQFLPYRPSHGLRGMATSKSIEPSTRYPIICLAVKWLCTGMTGSSESFSESSKSSCIPSGNPASSRPNPHIFRNANATLIIELRVSCSGKPAGLALMLTAGQCEPWRCATCWPTGS